MTAAPVFTPTTNTTPSYALKTLLTAGHGINWWKRSTHVKTLLHRLLLRGVYLEKAFENTSFRPKERLPVARELGETALMFLVHLTLTPDEIHKTCQVIHEVLKSIDLNKREFIMIRHWWLYVETHS